MSLSVILTELSKLRAALLAEIGDSRKKVDILDWASRVTLEIMGKAAIGVSFDPLTEHVHTPIAEALKHLV